MNFKTDEQLVKAFDEFCKQHKVEGGILIVMKDDERGIMATAKNPQFEPIGQLLGWLFMGMPREVYIPRDEN